MIEKIHLPAYLSLLIPLIGGIIIVALRIRATKKPTNARKIIIPPIGMSTGALMFIVPETRIPWSWALITLAVGAIVFSWPLIMTSKMEWVGDEIFIRRSKAFLYIILGLLAIRLVLHNVVEQYVTVYQTAGIFFLLAFGILLPWRIAMLQKFNKLRRQRESINT